MLICVKMFAESCSLFVLADGYGERKDKERRDFILLILVIYRASEFEAAQH